jgi:multisubunit Na+/H+ antiporter MnhC subunit
VAAWALGYLLRQVITRDVTLFYYFLIDAKAPDLNHLDFGLGEKLGYPAALVLTTLVYGFSLLALRCKHMSIYKVAQTRGRASNIFGTHRIAELSRKTD